MTGKLWISYGGKVRNTGIPKGNEIKKGKFFQRISNRMLEGSTNFFRISLDVFFRGEKE